MNKINFQNGTLVSKAKVTVNGTVYDVEPEVYDGQTPLSAENLNQMQTNAENAINEVQGNLDEKGIVDTLAVLSSGTSATITVNDLSDYSIIILQCCYVGNSNRILASSIGTYQQFKNADVNNQWECAFKDGTNYDVTAQYVNDTQVVLSRVGTYDEVVLLGIKG